MKAKRFAAFVLAAGIAAGALFVPTDTRAGLEMTASAAEKQSTKKLKAEDLSVKELAGEWEYYDFVKLDHTKGEKYDLKKQSKKTPYLYRIDISGSNAKVYCRDNDYSQQRIYKIKSNAIDDMKFRVYSDGDEKYLFLDWTQGGNTAYSYVFKYTNALKKGKMKETKLSEKELIGKWECCDFIFMFECKDGNKYYPNTRYGKEKFYFQSVEIADKNNIIMNFDGETQTVKTENGTFGGFAYKTYSFGKDKYMLIDYYTGAGCCVYAFKKTSSKKPEIKDAASVKQEKTTVRSKRITDTSKFEGAWTAYDFTGGKTSADAASYDPDNRSNIEPFLTSAVIKGSKVTFGYSSGEKFETEINNVTIGGDKFCVYEINGTMYLFYEWVTGYGVEGCYVLKKD